jgi:kinase suppressor of Ras 2
MESKSVLGAKMAATRTTSLDEYATSQAMIDINASHLDGLRTQCELTAALTQGEIRAIETKLVKLFGRQLVARQKAIKEGIAKSKNKPIQTKLWLKIVGLPDEAAEVSLKLVFINALQT